MSIGNIVPNMPIISFYHIHFNYSHSAEILSSVPPPAESNGCLNKSDPKPVTSRHSDGSHKSGSAKVTAVIPSLPATYVALYPYKPQKSDELELKKGCKCSC